MNFIYMSPPPPPQRGTPTPFYDLHFITDYITIQYTVERKICTSAS